MIRIFRHYVPQSLAVLGLVEAVFLFIAVEIASYVRLSAFGDEFGPLSSRIWQDLIFVLAVYVAMLAVGLYQQECCRDIRMSVSRMMAAWGFAFIIVSAVFYLLPHVSIWRSVFFYALVLSFVGIAVIRALFARYADMSALKRRIMVLGAGNRAMMIQQLEARDNTVGFTVGVYLRMEPNETAIANAIPRQDVDTLSQLIESYKITEVVLAMDERRGALPIADLLEARLRGTHIMELSDFLERETGRVSLETLRPSKIIFSDDFQVANRINQLLKRSFDIVSSLLLLFFSAAFLLFAAIAIKLTSPGPIFYRQTRVGQFGQHFDVYKFRSMRADAEKDGKPRWADKKDDRVTPVGRFLRSTRIDEIPQIINVLKGDMSFVGPRPERPFFVEELEREIPYYAERHTVKPGITGWAQLNYPYGASIEDARAKLEYDLYYVKNFTIFLDVLILIQTVRVVLWQDGVR